MSRRLDVELTSQRDDGSWTWRAAGAKQPKGVLDGSLLFEGVAVGDVVKVEAEIDLDGMVVTTVFPPKAARKEPERLELLGGGSEPGVTTKLFRKIRDDDGEGRGRGRRDGRGGRGDGPRGDRRDRGERGDRGPRSDRPRGERQGDNRRQRPDRGDRRPPSDAPARPRAKRLRPGRTHRNAWVDTLPDEQKPVADQLVRGGIPGVRKAIDAENTRAAEEGRPQVNAGPLLAMAEQLLPGLRGAEWMDRAEAAKKDLAELDLRDLRSVVVAAEDGARTDEARAVAQELREGLSNRVEAEQNTWLAEVRELLGEGRIVRALRVSSRPPKAGEPFPRDLAESMVTQANAALGSEVSQQRWGAVLEAVAYSPIRTAIEPAHIPAEPSEELLESVRKVASRVPAIAEKLGVTARPTRGRGGRGKGKPTPPPPPAPSTTSETPADAPTAPSTTSETPADAPTAPSTTSETPADAPTAPSTTSETPADAPTAPEADTSPSAPSDAAVAATASAEAPATDAATAESAEAPATADTDAATADTAEAPDTDAATAESAEAPATAEASSPDGPAESEAPMAETAEAPIADGDATPDDAVDGDTKRVD